MGARTYGLYEALIPKGLKHKALKGFYGKTMSRKCTRTISQGCMGKLPWKLRGNLVIIRAAGAMRFKV